MTTASPSQTMPRLKSEQESGLAASSCQHCTGGSEAGPGVSRGAGAAGHSPWQCQACRREEGTEAFPWLEVWLVVTFEHPEPGSSAGKPSYYPLVTKRDCETDVQSHALQDADCSIDLS